MKFYIPFTFILFFTNFLFAQQEGMILFEVKERYISETKWRYTSMVQKSSGTTIHKAEEDYEFLIYFRYDYTSQQYLNGNLTHGKWDLDRNILKYEFRNNDAFKISYVDKYKLVLEFKQRDIIFQYHYERAKEENLPFEKPKNELPTVNIKEKSSGVKRWVSALSKRKEKRLKRKNKYRKKSIIDRTYVSIELVGGGYYGGIDPVYRDFIRIKTNGRLMSEFKSKNNGLVKRDFKLSRDKILQIAKFAKDNGFFELPRIYECESYLCKKRKGNSPKPIPLRLSIAYGLEKKVVTINVYGKDHNKITYLEYPSILDELIDTIRDLAHSES